MPCSRCWERRPNRPSSCLLAGDLTDYGLPEEARILARELTVGPLPGRRCVLGITTSSRQGRRGAPDSQRSRRDGARWRRDETHGIGIAGVKGFGGGFGQRALGPWGEATIKQFVHEAVDEALKLETALARLRPVPARGAAALRARSTDRGRRAAGNLSVSRIEPPRRADQHAIRCRSSSTATRIADSSKADQHRRARLQRLDAVVARSFPDRPPFRIFEVPVG